MGIAACSASSSTSSTEYPSWSILTSNLPFTFAGTRPTDAICPEASWTMNAFDENSILMFPFERARHRGSSSLPRGVHIDRRESGTVRLIGLATQILDRYDVRKCWCSFCRAGRRHISPDLGDGRDALVVSLI